MQSLNFLRTMTYSSRIRALISSIPVLVSMLANNWMEMDRYDFFSDTTTSHRPSVEYDFIIVGGGTAGLVLANRLSEKFSVLVLEAGGRPPPLVGVPAFIAQINAVPEINFMYRSTPQENAGLNDGGFVPVSAGRMLGGSSSHNYMAWEHGHREDYGRWAYLAKDSSWRYENLLPYFRKIESYRTILSSKGYKRPGEPGGQSSLSFGQDFWFEGGRQLGYNVRDPRKPQTIGFNPIVYSTSRGMRASSYTLYLQPILHETWRRLTVFKYSYVSRVIIENHRAVGVEYERHGVSLCAFALKEVILSAGAFISPIILFKSGVGPKSQVVAAKIPTHSSLWILAEHHIMDLPVGLNLQDHTLLPVTPILLNDPGMIWSLERNLTAHDFDLLQKGLGPLTTSFHGSEAFVRSDQLNQHGWTYTGMDGWPDLQVIYNPTGEEVNAATCLISNGQPASRGVLTINASATSMADNYLPILDYNYFGADRDFDITITGIEFCLKIVEGTNGFRSTGARLQPFGPCWMYPFRSRAYWKCYIRYRVGTYYHSSGTCRMGHGKSDPMAVVDSKLRVIGVERLRVVDASIMPFVTNANIMAPTMVIAEKAADDILNDHAQQNNFLYNFYH